MKLWPEWLMWYNLWYPLKNIWKWRKAIWSSRPWDGEWLYLLLRDQIAYMEESNVRYSYHLTKQQKCKEMRICLNLLDRLIKDEYLTDKQDFHLNDQNILKSHFTPKYFLPKGDMNKINDSRQKADKELLFKILKRKINSWWH